jgi:hypothetical protein
MSTLLPNPASGRVARLAICPRDVLRIPVAARIPPASAARPLRYGRRLLRETGVRTRAVRVAVIDEWRLVRRLLALGGLRIWMVS